MRVEEIMALAEIEAGGRPVKEEWMQGTCPHCGTESRLSDAEVRVQGRETVYICPACSRIFIRVTPAPDSRGGYRLKDWVFHPLGGMGMDVPGLDPD